MSERFQHIHPSYLQLTKWTAANPQLKAGMTTRLGGEGVAPYDSFNLGWHVPDAHEIVLRNRQKLAQLLEFPLQNWVSGQQVHGTLIHQVTKQDVGKGALSQASAIPQCDGLLTNEKGVLLTAFYADCVPLLFHDPINGWIGIAHAGWRGTVAGIGSKMVQALIERGAKASNIRVAIGPSITGEAYEVDDHVVKHIPSCYRQEPFVVEKHDGKYMLYLQRFHKQLLLNEGLSEHHIDITQYCTYRNEELFFSYRRDNGQTGRMLAFIGMKR
ncbi:peptidoglycan editing factor PgeF [Pontibacillus litoralis]|uniref:Purine nucleoside phosphorylase n=1 Tax=Pontibacillus litoralis JSM 072002 TaxID=1385512 RepID=A0A0A5HY58_9BACI|nr:peptidoglycan editing factor PgeF [Pontibacillus litoralis]KGX88527.1 hypothetical protein N784_07610 [Pontibacillus litoralis JSM 072002]